MPNCIIMGCPHKTGNSPKFPGIVLHSFPSSIERIKKWILQTGQVFQDPDSLANKIYEGKKTDTFRMCSAHFTKDSYIFTAQKRFLKHNALPAIFPQAADAKALIDEQKIIGKRKKKCERLEAKSLSSFICSKCLTSENIRHGKILVDAATQTENEPQKCAPPMTQAVLMLSVPLQSYCTQHITPLIKQPLHPHSMVTHNADLHSADLHNTDPHNADLHNTDLHNADLHSTDLHNADLHNTDLHNADLRNTDLHNANLHNADLRNTNLHNAGPHNTDLHNADPHHADLHNTDLHSADLHNADPHNTDLQNTDLHNSMAATSSLVEKEDLPFSASANHNKDYECAGESPPQQNTASSSLQRLVRGRKLLVFEDCLDSLVYMVQCRGASGCSKTVTRFNKEYKGSAVIIRGQCHAGHCFKIWESQPKVKRFYAGNVLMAASLFSSGLKYQEACDLLNTLGLRHISEETYHHLRKHYCYPAIRAAWAREHDDVTRELQDRPVCLSGDRRSVTSGPNAQRCVYVISDALTDKIIDFEMIVSAPSQSLMDAEKLGLEACLSRAAARGLDVACFVSDGSQSFVETMKESYAHVDHQFYVQRCAKRMLKKLRDASRLPSCASIRPWISNVYEHFLWSVQTAENNRHLLREKWLSLLHHIVNEHSWEDGRLYKQCDHEDLSHKTSRETLWLKPGSPSFEKVKEIVSDPQLMEDLRHLTWNFHSRASSTFHSSVLKFRTRRPHAGLNELEARVKLEALKHNHSAGQTETKVRVPYGNSTSDDAARRKWHVRTYDYLWPVMEGVLGICEGQKNT